MKFSPYEFKTEDAFDFARFINAKTKPPTGDELSFESCPYCKPNKKEKTNLNSFSINLRTGKFKCLRDSCGVMGNMITLSKDFGFSLGNEIDEYYAPKRKFKSLKTPKDPVIPKPEAIAYLEGRGISERVAKEYEITVRTDDSKVLVFPFYDEVGQLQLVKYRRTDYDQEKHNGKEWSEADCKPILFGMKQCKNFDRLIITEGQADSLSVAEAGIDNAVSVPTGAKGFTWIPYCWNWITQFKEIVVFGDCENGRITLLEDISKRFKCKIKHVREEDYKGCKDANDILRKYGKEQVRKCVENAVIVPIKQVIPLSKVENADPFKIPKIPTGIKQLDRLLYGGFPLGGIVIITGKTGCGKSTFASQILINAISNGYKCFAYSGELVNTQFKFGIDFQIAGGNSIFEYQNKWGDTMYNLSNENRNAISNWYDEKLWIYDNSVIESDEQDELLKLVEKAVTQYQVKVILIDNLMTAMSLSPVSGSDQYERQAEFVNRISVLAKRYEVIIFLVAHKRKNGFSSGDENDEISGSSKIANLASIIISYDKSKELLGSQRVLKVPKERLFGRTETNGYILDYDAKSRRICGYGDDVNIDYGWNADDDGFTEISIDAPFD